jgi:hypothetical protein
MLVSRQRALLARCAAVTYARTITAKRMDSSCWMLVQAACAPKGAAAARAVLLGSSRVQAELRSHLETMVRYFEEQRTGGLDAVRLNSPPLPPAM